MKTRVVMQFFLSAAMSVLAPGVTFAQSRVFLEDVSGKAIRVGQYENVEGSPYLLDNWSKGKVKVENGREYEGLDLKYDQVEDMLLYKNEKGETFKFAEPVVAFTIMDGAAQREFRNGFPPAGTATKDSFYEVLANGGATLLKRSAKVVRQEKTYNSATVNKSIQPIEVYYIAKNNVLERVKKDQDSILEALGDKKEQLRKFIKENRLYLRDASDLIKLVNYYNSI
jgi:hypothetical protein